MEKKQLTSINSSPSEKVIVQVFQVERDVDITAHRTGTTAQRVIDVLEEYGFDFSFMPAIDPALEDSGSGACA